MPARELLGLGEQHLAGRHVEKLEDHGDGDHDALATFDDPADAPAVAGARDLDRERPHPGAVELEHVLVPATRTLFMPFVRGRWCRCENECQPQ